MATGMSNNDDYEHRGNKHFTAPSQDILDFSVCSCNALHIAGLFAGHRPSVSDSGFRRIAGQGRVRKAPEFSTSWVIHPAARDVIMGGRVAPKG